MRRQEPGAEIHVCSLVPFAGHGGSRVLLLLCWTGRCRLECGSSARVRVLRDVGLALPGAEKSSARGVDVAPAGYC